MTTGVLGGLEEVKLPESHRRTDLTGTLPPLALTARPPPSPSLRLLLPQEVTLHPQLTLKARCLCHHPAEGSGVASFSELLVSEIESQTDESGSWRTGHVPTCWQPAKAAGQRSFVGPPLGKWNSQGGYVRSKGVGLWGWGRRVLAILKCSGPS